MRSAVDFAAVFHSGDANGISVVMEADAVVADAKAELGRLDVLETLDVALASVQIAGQRMEDAESSGLIDGAELSLGLVSLLPMLSDSSGGDRAECDPCAQNLRE
jgi:hypothetical protein